MPAPPLARLVVQSLNSGQLERKSSCPSRTSPIKHLHKFHRLLSLEVEVWIIFATQQGSVENMLPSLFYLHIFLCQGVRMTFLGLIMSSIFSGYSVSTSGNSGSSSGRPRLIELPSERAWQALNTWCLKRRQLSHESENYWWDSSFSLITYTRIFISLRRQEDNREGAATAAVAARVFS